MNRWNNGVLKIEFLEPINIANYSKDSLRQLSRDTHDVMKSKIAQLDEYVSANDKGNL